MGGWGILYPFRPLQGQVYAPGSAGGTPSLARKAGYSPSLPGTGQSHLNKWETCARIAANPATGDAAWKRRNPYPSQITSPASVTREWSAPESAKLGDIIAGAVCAVIAGADSRVDIASIGNVKLDWFVTFIELPNGIPSHDTFGRVFSLIDARRFQDIFIEWTKRVWEAAEGRGVAIDGKAVRRSADKANGESPIHMAGAWAPANGAALRQVKTDDHSNEITAIPKLLKTLNCRKKVARQTIKRGADCVLAVKKNQPRLWDDIAGAFEYGERTRFASIEHDVFETVNKGHGRIERRRRLGDLRPSAVGHANDRGEWANMNSAAMTESTRWADGETTVHRRRFITCLPAQAGRILGAVRERWGIENGLHRTPARSSGRTGA